MAELSTGHTYAYSEPERNAILLIGKHIATIASNEASVLVRREVSIAIATATKFNPERFVRAALLTAIPDIGNMTPEVTDPLANECEVVQKNLWISLSELAYDPHPVAAAIARRSLDRIEDMLAERMGRPDPSSSPHEIPLVDHALSSLEEVEQGFICGTSNSADGISALIVSIVVATTATTTASKNPTITADSCGHQRDDHSARHCNRASRRHQAFDPHAT